MNLSTHFSTILTDFFSRNMLIDFHSCLYFFSFSLSYLFTSLLINLFFRNMKKISDSWIAFKIIDSMLFKSFQSFKVYLSIISELLKIFKYYFIIFFIIGGNRLVISVKLLLFNIKSINSLQKYPLGGFIIHYKSIHLALVWRIHNFLIFHSIYILYLYSTILIFVLIRIKFMIYLQFHLQLLSYWIILMCFIFFFLIFIIFFKSYFLNCSFCCSFNCIYSLLFTLWIILWLYLPLIFLVCQSQVIFYLNNSLFWSVNKPKYIKTQIEIILKLSVVNFDG